MNAEYLQIEQDFIAKFDIANASTFFNTTSFNKSQSWMIIRALIFKHLRQINTAISFLDLSSAIDQQLDNIRFNSHYRVNRTAVQNTIIGYIYGGVALAIIGNNHPFFHYGQGDKWAKKAGLPSYMFPSIYRRSLRLDVYKLSIDFEHLSLPEIIYQRDEQEYEKFMKKGHALAQVLQNIELTISQLGQKYKVIQTTTSQSNTIQIDNIDYLKKIEAIHTLAKDAQSLKVISEDLMHYITTSQITKLRYT